MTYLRRTRKPTAAPKRPKQSRVGKATGTIRLYGNDRSALKDRVYLRAQGRCELLIVCNGEYVPYKDGHLAHTKSVGSGGNDSESNTKFACPGCHIRSHAYGSKGAKPCPTK